MTKLGIDLGTATTRVARVDARGLPVLVPDLHEADRSETASVVLVDRGLALVGRDAENLAESEPGLPVAHAFKEKLGRPEPALTDTEGRNWPSGAVVALLFKKLLRDARARGQSVEAAALAVPPSFGVDQRRELRRAARWAELPILGLIEEPIAVAVHYEAHRETEGTNSLVLDLGGSGGRATVLRSGPDGPRIVRHEVDPRLAGSCFDGVLIDFLAEAAISAIGIDPREDPAARLVLIREARRLKVEIANTDALPVRTMMLLVDRIVEAVVTRGQIDRLTSPLLDRARPLCESALRGADLDWKDLGLILLAGGSANLPAFIPAITRWSGLSRDRIRRQQPERAVACGAALIAAGRAGPLSGGVPRVAEADLGFLVIDPDSNIPTVDVIIPRGTPIPTRRGAVYYSSRADQRRMFFEVVEVHDSSSTPTSLGRFAFPLDPPGKNRRLEVSLGYDALGLPLVEARDPDTGRVVRRDLGDGIDSEEDPVRLVDGVRLVD